jgi:hypothetical protein
MARLEVTGAGGTRVVRVQALFRAVNEQTLTVIASNALGRLTEVLCECSDDECIERIPLSTEEYDRVRLFPTRFLVRPGHISPETDRLVERTERYTVVEKTGESAAFALRLDPRRPDAPTKRQAREEAEPAPAPPDALEGAAPTVAA